MDGTSTPNTLKRRNSVPSTVILPNGNHRLHNHNNYKLTTTSPPPATLLDFKLVSLDFPSQPASYTSLKDIIPCSSPSSILSPTPGPTYSAVSGAVSGAVSSPSFGSGYEISIRNRLVKQAAWAYLQPTVPSSPSSSSSSRCICLSGEVLRPIIGRFREILCGAVTRVYDWLVDMLWLILCR